LGPLEQTHCTSSNISQGREERDCEEEKGAKELIELVTINHNLITSGSNRLSKVLLEKMARKVA